VFYYPSVELKQSGDYNNGTRENVNIETITPGPDVINKLLGFEEVYITFKSCEAQRE
jgi:hypothetical protein